MTLGLNCLRQHFLHSLHLNSHVPVKLSPGFLCQVAALWANPCRHHGVSFSFSKLISVIKASSETPIELIPSFAMADGTLALYITFGPL